MLQCFDPFLQIRLQLCYTPICVIYSLYAHNVPNISCINHLLIYRPISLIICIFFHKYQSIRLEVVKKKEKKGKCCFQKQDKNHENIIYSGLFFIYFFLELAHFHREHFAEILFEPIYLFMHVPYRPRCRPYIKKETRKSVEIIFR